MKDNFQWTPELLAEFFNTHPDLLPTLMNEINLFKSSKAPKKEWEVVAFQLEDKIYKLTNDGKYRDVRPAYSDGVAYFGLDYAFEPKNNCTIHSVRRLSDGEVFSVGERFTCSVYAIQKCIKGFIINDSGWLQIKMDDGDTLSHVYGNPLEGLKKLPHPILTTVDGAGIMEDQPFWVVGDDCQLSERIAGPASPKYIRNGDNIFSTLEAAEDYVFNNRPLLSLNDVKEALESKGQTGAIGELTALVKQKLNP